jgi:chromosome segregation ATPase
VWFNKARKQQKQLDTLEAHLFNMKKRLREVKRELTDLKNDQRKLERELLLKLGRLEGVLGIGLSGGAEEMTTTPPGIDFERRRQEEEAERIALEQLGTGGSAQSVLDPVVEREEGD